MQYNNHVIFSKKKIPTGGVGICKEGVMK